MQRIMIILFVFIAVFVCTEVGQLPTTIAQQKHEWKTYYNPTMGFSINYPTHNNRPAIISENLTGIVKVVEISIPTFNVVFHIINDSILDSQRQAIQSKIIDEKYQKRTTPIKPITLNGVAGYFYITMDTDTLFTTTNIFTSLDNRYFEIYLSGFKNDIYMNDIGKILNSLKFFK